MKKCDIFRFALSQFHPGICLYRTNTEVLRVFNTIETTLFLCYYHLCHIHDQHHTHMPIECIYLFKWNYIQNGIYSFKNEFEIATDTYVNTFNALNELRGKWSLDDSNNTNRKLFLNCMKNNKIKKRENELKCAHTAFVEMLRIKSENPLSGNRTLKNSVSFLFASKLVVVYNVEFRFKPNGTLGSTIANVKWSDDENPLECTEFR